MEFIRVRERMSFIQYIMGFIYNELCESNLSRKIYPEVLPLVNPSSLKPIKCLDFDIDHADLRKENKIKKIQVKQKTELKEELIIHDFV